MYGLDRSSPTRQAAVSHGYTSALSINVEFFPKRTPAKGRGSLLSQLKIEISLQLGYPSHRHRLRNNNPDSFFLRNETAIARPDYLPRWAETRCQ